VTEIDVRRPVFPRTRRIPPRRLPFREAVERKLAGPRATADVTARLAARGGDVVT
jgi:hypothetical protein